MALISFGFRPVVVDISGNWWVDSFESYALASLVDDGLWNSGNETTSSLYFDGPWDGGQSTVPNTHGRDFFDTYTAGDDLGGLNGGFYWTSVWYSYDSYAPSLFGLDYFDTYTLNSNIDGLDGGAHFSSSWIAGETYLTYYSSTGNEVDLRASSFSGYSVATSSALIVPSFEDNNALAVLVIMRRSALTTDMSSWTLVEEQKNSTTQAAIDQWTSIYSIPFNQLVTGSYLQIEQASSVRFALSLVVLDSISGNPILVQGTAKGQYSAAANPGLHPIQSLASLGNGRLGMVASSCIYQSVTGDTQYSFTSPWAQTTTPVLQDNRLCVATLPLNNGDNVINDISHISHSAANHDGSEISVIFYTI